MTTTNSRSNRLAHESSPYLLLHAHNPVDWYPWGEEALARARAEDKPIFLSVGYSTCYWCHVMERESFSDSNVAALMNREFVNIKLDREERPELDEIYMIATQILAGQGGWPNSVFLTPDLKPFFAGTYFPPEDHRGRPSFRTVLTGLSEAWKTRRSDVGEQAEELGIAMRRALEERGKPGATPPAPEAAARALDQLARRFDLDWGGFGSAPKFPSPSNLDLLLDFAEEREEADKMLSATLDGMAMGGLFDQLAGGFHRYATDRQWRVPHFEKMLYDNGLLLEVYARAAAAQLDPFYGRTARATADFLAREMTSPQGAFWSAIDAETDGREGAYYAWTRQELETVLGREDYAFLAPLLGFDGPPFFEGEHYVLHLPERLEAAAAKRKMELATLLAEIEPLRARLLAARSERKRPATDDKILTDWNGTAISGLATAGRLLAVPEYVERAARAADFLLTNLRPAGGSLHHAWRAGTVKVPAFLADYAYLVRGLLALHRAENADGESRWLTAARELVAEQDERLGDPTGVGGWFAAAASPDVLFRSKEVFDGALPAANAVAVENLLDLFAITGEEGFREAARRALATFAAPVHQHPDGSKSMALAARRFWREAAAGEEPVLDETPTLEALAAQAEQVVSPQFEISEERVDGWRAFRLVLDIARGWHLNANPASLEQLVPTRVDAQGARLERVIYPSGTEVQLGFAEKPIVVYQGRVEITGEVALDAPEARLLLTYQPCDESRCLPPITRVATLG